MNRDERICHICGKRYNYCPNCSRYLNYPRYMNMFCSENCLNVYQIISGYVEHDLSKVEAKELLSDIDASGEQNYRGSWKKVHDEIMIEDKVAEIEPVEEVNLQVKQGIKKKVNTKSKKKISKEEDI